MEPVTDSWAGPPTSLSGQVAVITGSSAGIGLATAVQLARAGVHIVLNGRDRDRLAAAQLRVRAAAADSEVVSVAGDATTEATVSGLCAAALELGGMHIAVACVGGGTVGVTVAGLTADQVLGSASRNLVPPALLIRSVSPHMSEQRYGRIVTLASLAGRRYGRVSGPDYSAAKAGVIALTRHAAAELAATGVTVNCVAPGIIQTERALGMVAALPGQQQAAAATGTPMGRWGTADEVAAAIVFLASPAASYITGATLDVNGGAHMG